MEILGVGVPELGFIVLIALILLGPKDMIAAGRTVGKTLRKIITSPTWKAVRTTGQELQQLPNRLIREAGLEDLEKEVQEATRFNIDPRQVISAAIEEQSDVTYDSTPDPDSGSGASPEDPQV